MGAVILGYTDSNGVFRSLCSSAGVAISSDLTLDPTNLNLEATQAAVLAKIIAAPATEAKQDTLKAVIGAVDDVAWTGVGNGTVISILKAIAINTVPLP